MKIEKLLDRFLKYKEITNCDGDVYLKRWYLFRREYLNIYIHKFLRSDEDRANHTHPFFYIVIPIIQGYLEHREKRDDEGKLVKSWIKRVYPILGIRFRAPDFCHRVELINGKMAWSLFVRFKRQKEWGFWQNNKFINWKDWWKQNCGD